MGEEIKNIDDLLSQYIGPEKKIISSNVSKLTAPGENYMSVVFKVDATLKDEETGKEEKISGVAKCLHSGDIHEMMKMLGRFSYNTERAFYTEIVPTLLNFLKEKNFHGNFDIFPKLIAFRPNLHGENDEVDEDSVLMMENLSLEGYANIDRHVGFDYEGAKMILKDIATFHAVPIAMKLKKRKLFEEKIKKHLIRPDFKPPEPKEGEEGRKPPEFRFDNWLDSLATRGHCKLYLPGLKNIFEFIKENPGAMWGKRDVREPFATISHNDLWVNNTMQVFRDGVMLKNKLIDFQVYRYGSPANDVLFFIWSSVQLPVLKSHFSDLIKHYYDSFIEVLNEFGCNTTVFSFEKFNEELKIATKVEFMHNLMFTKVIFAEKGQLAFDMKAVTGEGPPKEEVISETVLDRVAFILQICGKRGWV